MIIKIMDCCWEPSNFKSISRLIFEGDDYDHLLWTNQNSNKFLSAKEEYGEKTFDHFTLIFDAASAIISSNPEIINTKETIYSFLDENNEDVNNMFFSLNNTIDIVKSPIKIFVENHINDKNFIVSFMCSEKKTHFLNTKKVNFVHGGGITDLYKLVKNEVSSVKSWFALRNFVLFDSDLIHPGDTANDTEKIKKLCIKHSIPYCCLDRRCIENYIPISTFYNYINYLKGKEKSSFRKKVAAYTKLSTEQRKYFNVKNGFNGDRKHLRKSKVTDKLYSNINNTDKVALENGMGENIFSSIYSKELFNVNELKKDGSTNEIIPIIEKLFRLI